MIETKPFRRRIKDGQNRIAMVNGGGYKGCAVKAPGNKGPLIVDGLVKSQAH
jgi:hypothetical protein